MIPARVAAIALTTLTLSCAGDSVSAGDIGICTRGGKLRGLLRIDAGQAALTEAADGLHDYVTADDVDDDLERLGSDVVASARAAIDDRSRADARAAADELVQMCEEKELTLDLSDPDQ